MSYSSETALWNFMQFQFNQMAQAIKNLEVQIGNQAERHKAEMKELTENFRSGDVKAENVIQNPDGVGVRKRLNKETNGTEPKYAKGNEPCSEPEPDTDSVQTAGVSAVEQWPERSPEETSIHC